MMEDDTTSASDIALFKSGGSEAPAKTESPTVETVATTATQERDETGKFKGKETEATQVVTETKAEKGDEKAEVKTEAKTEVAQEKTPVSALIAMRQRLAAAEQRVRELEQGKTETPDIFTEPEKAVQALVEKQVAPIKIKFFNRSVEDAQKAHSDFDAAYNTFATLIDTNPALLQELRQHDDPGEYIYQVGSNTPEFRQQRDAKHREEVSAKDAEIAALKAKLEAAESAQKARSEVPESLNRQPSGAVPARDSDKTDINQIVRFKSG